MYKINDTVLYGSHGACIITEISKLSFGGPEKQYYILKPVHNSGSTVYVPVDNNVLTSKMRQILSIDEIQTLIHDMPVEKALWIEDETKRKEKYHEILLSGDRHKLIGMIKALYQHQKEQNKKGKRLHATDERIFKEAEKLLYDEFAFVLQIKPSQVLPFIMEQLPLN